MKTITTFVGLKKGQKFKAIANTNSHSYPLNKILTLSKDGTGTTMTNCAVEVEYGNTIAAKDVILCNLTIEEMLSQIDELEKEIAVLESKILFCEETESTEYDDDTYKAFSTLKIINSLGTDIEKAKAIAQLLKQ